MSPQESSTNRTSTESWDPYDVWLKRVKQPRERAPRRTDVVAPGVDASDEQHADDTHVESGRLIPGVS